MLIDRFLPTFDVTERHAIEVKAEPPTVYDAVRHLDLSRSGLVRALFAVRGIPRLLRRSRPQRSMTLDDLVRGGFVVLGEEPGVEIVLGVVGRFWTPSGGVRRVAPEDFAAFDEPGLAKAAWTFRVGPRRDGGSFVYTETRVCCSDARTRRRFLLYWSVIGPFSGVIRRQALRLIRSDAERPLGGPRVP